MLHLFAMCRRRRGSTKERASDCPVLLLYAIVAHYYDSLVHENAILCYLVDNYVKNVPNLNTIVSVTSTYVMCVVRMYAQVNHS